METYEAILTRRSIRRYKKDPVPSELITELLRAGMSAPTGGGDRPWHFVVIDDRKIMEKVPEFHEYAISIKDAPLAITVCGDTSIGRIQGFWVQDCSAAAQNILLALHAKGLGGVWLGLYPVQERVDGMRKLLNLPLNIVPVCVITLGYPAVTKPALDRYDPAKVHHNVW